MTLNYCVRDDTPLSRELWRTFLEQLCDANAQLHSKSLSALDAVHEARRALKRARAAMRLLGLSVPGFAESVDRDARELGRLLSEFRDQDVILEMLDSMIAKADIDSMSSPVHAYLWYVRTVEERKRDNLTRSFPEVAAAFDKQVHELEQRGESATLGQLGPEVVLIHVAGSLRSIQTRFARARSRNRPDAFHKCRKLTQRALNQSHLLRRLYPEWVAANFDRLEALAKALGGLQDLYVLEARIIAPEKDKLLRKGARQLLRRAKREQEGRIEVAHELQALLRTQH